MNIAIVSGGFDPIHSGHLEYIKKAREIADCSKDGKLIAIVNKDSFLLQKKGYYCLDEKTRLDIVSNIKGIDSAILAVDNDLTVCKTLEKLADLYKNTMYQLYFCKGGDRNSSNIPELLTCKKCGIKIIDGLGAKINSSSDIINRLKNMKKV